MPKPTITQRFHVHFDISPEKLGPILVLLSGLEIDNVGYEIITDVQQYARNKPKQAALPAPAPADTKPPAPAHQANGATTLKSTVPERIVQTLRAAKGHSLMLDEITARGEFTSKQSVSSSMGALLKDKRIERVGKATYALGPKEIDGTAAPAASMLLKDLIIEALSDGEWHTPSSIIESVQKKRSTTAASSVRSYLTGMMKDKTIRREEDDGQIVYSLRRPSAAHSSQSVPA